MSKNLPAFSFEWAKDTFQFNEDLLKNYDEQSEIGYILKVDLNIPKNYTNPTTTYHSYQKERNLQ